jgi:putative serine protease PepD
MFGGPPATPTRAERGRPGWGGVIGVGAGAAVLASLLTAGVMTVADNGGTTASPVTSSAPAAGGSQSAPLVTSSSTLPDWVAVAGAVEPSVVSVQVSAGRSSGEGSGVILDPQGRILTNNHVISAASSGGEISVVLSDGRAYPAAIVGADPATDLAVIKLNTVPSGLKPATLGDSAAVKVGDPVMAVGNPLGLSDTVTTGIVSALNRPVSANDSQGSDPFGGGTTSEPVVTNAIQTDASINPGNSGGALVDSGGRVIGVTSSIASLSSGSGQSGSIGLGFAIPINEAKQIADELISTGKVQHAYLGVTLSDDSVALDGAQREAAILRTVGDGTPAAKAGLKTGDAVIAINGRPIDSSTSLIGTIRAIKPGTQITLTVVRDGKSLQVPVTLATRPSTAG